MSLFGSYTYQIIQGMCFARIILTKVIIDYKDECPHLDTAVHSFDLNQMPFLSNRLLNIDLTKYIKSLYVVLSHRIAIFSDSQYQK